MNIISFTLITCYDFNIFYFNFKFTSVNIHNKNKSVVFSSLIRLIWIQVSCETHIHTVHKIMKVQSKMYRLHILHKIVDCKLCSMTRCNNPSFVGHVFLSYNPARLKQLIPEPGPRTIHLHYFLSGRWTHQHQLCHLSQK